MKKIFSSILVLFFLSILNTSLAQGVYQNKSWALGIILSPDLSNTTIQSVNSFPEAPPVFDYTKLAFTGGFQASYVFSPLVSFETGLLFANRGYSYRPDFSYTYSDNTPEPIIDVLNRINYNYLDIPLKVNFKFNLNKISFFTSAGLAPGILVNSNTVRIKSYMNDFSKERIKNTEEINKFNLTSTLSFGTDIGIKESWVLRFEPMFRYSLINLYPDENRAPKNLYSLGLNFALFYKIALK